MPARGDAPPYPPLRPEPAAWRRIRVLPFLVAAVCGCSTTTSGVHGEPPEGATPAKEPRALLPPPPAGLSAAVEVTPRGRGDIVEEINGGSDSFLENGMQDAVFATYPRSGEEVGVDVEIYRFGSPEGANKQFDQIQSGEGAAWELGSRAVVHEYGVELCWEIYVVRATFNDGPQEAMVEAAKELLRGILRAAGAR